MDLKNIMTNKIFEVKSEFNVPLINSSYRGRDYIHLTKGSKFTIDKDGIYFLIINGLEEDAIFFITRELNFNFDFIHLNSNLNKSSNLNPIFLDVTKKHTREDKIAKLLD